MGKKRPVLTVKYEFDLLFDTDKNKRVATVVSHESKVDLLSDIAENYDRYCSNFLNQHGEYEYTEIVEVFNHWIDMAKKIILSCYPIVINTFTLNYMNELDEKQGLKAAIDFMHFLDDYLNITFYSESRKSYGVLEASCMIPLDGIKEISISEAEKLIKDKLHMNVIITSDR